MRLPLRHPPPAHDEPRRRCAHLEALALAAIGLPLGPAAALVASSRSRGRHGNALQWHFGLEPHDALPELDWEDRIEIKLISVWSRGQGSLACDKVKVCDLNIDPWHKLGNVLWVLADRLTRVVVGARFTTLGGAHRQRLARAWELDPHFEHPDLFVEARETDGRRSPAYYLSARWLLDEGIVPPALDGVFPFDARWWMAARAEHGRDPLATIAEPTGEGRVACPRCGGPIDLDAASLIERGWSPARHGMPMRGMCAIAGHFAVNREWLRPGSSQTHEEFRAALEHRVPPEEVWRLTDRVAEPDDHLH